MNFAPRDCNLSTTEGTVAPSLYILSRVVPNTIARFSRLNAAHRLSTSLYGGQKSHRSPRFSVRRGVTLKLSWKYTAYSFARSLKVGWPS